MNVSARDSRMLVWGVAAQKSCFELLYQICTANLGQRMILNIVDENDLGKRLKSVTMIGIQNDGRERSVSVSWMIAVFSSRVPTRADGPGSGGMGVIPQMGPRMEFRRAAV